MYLREGDRASCLPRVDTAEGQLAVRRLLGGTGGHVSQGLGDISNMTHVGATRVNVVIRFGNFRDVTETYRRHQLRWR